VGPRNRLSGDQRIGCCTVTSHTSRRSGGLIALRPLGSASASSPLEVVRVGEQVDRFPHRYVQSGQGAGGLYEVSVQIHEHDATVALGGNPARWGSVGGIVSVVRDQKSCSGVAVYMSGSRHF